MQLFSWNIENQTNHHDNADVSKIAEYYDGISVKSFLYNVSKSVWGW